MEVACPARRLFSSSQYRHYALDDFYQPTDPAIEVERRCRLEVERFRILYNFDLETMQPSQPTEDKRGPGDKSSENGRVLWKWETLNSTAGHVPLFYRSQTIKVRRTRRESEIQRIEHRSESPKKIYTTVRRDSKSSTVPQGKQLSGAHLHVNNIPEMTCGKAEFPTLFILWLPRIRRCSNPETEPKRAVLKFEAPRIQSFDKFFTGSGAQFVRSKSCEQRVDKRSSIRRATESCSRTSDRQDIEDHFFWRGKSWIAERRRCNALHSSSVDVTQRSELPSLGNRTAPLKCDLPCSH
ncbi:unnamed protein product [Dicrocoelium dendriticum]|nr:unnamed protein product [Dicrocoelium dendriticum]